MSEQSSVTERSRSTEAVAEPVEAPNHILIEGDNLHALTALTFTHEGKVDVIYTDPPYNTGNKDFKYNDSFVDREDSNRHSKWLSFMHKRLQIAKRLLSEKGVIFISIDDNEVAQLKIQCDEIFLEQNFIGIINWQRAYSPKNQSKKISKDVEYIICYAKNYEATDFSLLPRTEKMNNRYKNPDNDSRGPWKPGDLIANEERKNGHYIIVGPKGNKFDSPPGKHWSFAQDKMEALQKDNRLFFGKEGTAIPSLKQFLTEVQQGRKASTLFLHDEAGHNDEAKKELKEFFNQSDELFSTPKPTRLIKQLLRLSINKNPIVLDFFAGSGTTLQSIITLNNEDGQNRQCILVTNNENNICEEITYERNRKVIQGYTNAKGEQVAGLTNNNLRYYKSEFVNREPNIKNKRELTKLATELLCIKEDCYNVLELPGMPDAKMFGNKQKYLLIIYNDATIEEAVEFIKTLADKEIKVKVYVFSNGQYAYTEEFEEVLDRVELCALPDAIYKAYQNVLPKKKREAIPVLDDDAVDSQTNETSDDE